MKAFVLKKSNKNSDHYNNQFPPDEALSPKYQAVFPGSLTLELMKFSKTKQSNRKFLKAACVSNLALTIAD